MEKIINFWEIFKQNPDGSIQPIKIVKIGSVQMGPGVIFGSGASFGGVNLAQYAGKRLRIQETTGGVTSILSILEN